MIEILKYNYWEHFKAAKDLSRIYKPDHQKIIALQTAMNEILKKINKTNKPADQANSL